MRFDRGAALSLFVLAVLVLCLVHPAAFAQPYDSTAVTYEIAHESTDAFEETVARDDVDPAEPIAVEALSPSTQRAFEEAKAQPQRQGGWQYLGSVSVCNEVLLVCDEYDDRPEFPENVDAYETYGLVADDGEVYLTHTDSGDGSLFGSGFGALLFKIVLLVPYAAFLGATVLCTISRTNAIRRNETLAFAGWGLVLAAVAFAYPHLHAFDFVPWPLRANRFVIGMTWTIVLVGTGLYLYRSVVAVPATTGDGDQ